MDMQQVDISTSVDDDVQGFGRAGGAGIEIRSLIGIPWTGVVTAAAPQLPAPSEAAAESQVIPLGRRASVINV